MYIFIFLLTVISTVHTDQIKCGFNLQPASYDGNSTSNLTFVLSARDLGPALNPTVAVFFTSEESINLKVFGTSEPGKTHEPDWNKVFWFIWKKGIGQKWHFHVIEQLQAKVRKIGEGILDVDNYVESGQDAKLILDGRDDRKGKTIIVKKTTPIQFKLSAKNLSQLDEFSTRSDPFVKIYFRRQINGTNNKFYTTSIINNVNDANWDDVINFENCQRGVEQYLFFKVRDHDTVTKNDHLGEALLSVDQLLDSDECRITIPLTKSIGNSTLTIKVV